MTLEQNMYLVFRIAGIGFCLPVAGLVEILDKGQSKCAGLVDSTSEGQRKTLSLHGCDIPMIDGRECYELPPGRGSDAMVLVIAALRGNLALMVDTVDGIFPAKGFKIQDVPLLLCDRDQARYRLLALWRNEPLVFCDAAALEAAVYSHG